MNIVHVSRMGQPLCMLCESSDPDLVLFVPLLSLPLHHLLAAVGVGAQHLTTHQAQHGRLTVVTVLPPIQPLGTLEPRCLFDEVRVSLRENYQLTGDLEDRGCGFRANHVG